MRLLNKDAVIIGGGPAGLAAAIQLKKNGIDNILIIEREKNLGGILRQCIHDGFGLTRFGKSLSGPEYAQIFIDEANDLGIEALTDTSVINITYGKVVTAVNRGGIFHVQSKAVVLAMGCRERTRGAINIPGARPAGIYNAGVAQSYINLHNTMVGREIVILGSGDIGMIMARRLTLEGAHVKAVFEAQAYPSGLPRNIEQCLNDYGIPLYLSHTVTKICGRRRVEGVVVSRVDSAFSPIDGTGKFFSCDTLILSVGLIPENELSLMAGVELDRRTRGAYVNDSFETGCSGIFAAGNVLHVHDLVDFVSIEAEELAASAAEYVSSGCLPKASIVVVPGRNVGYAVPQRVSGEKNFTLSFRVKRPIENCKVTVSQGGNVISEVKMRKAIPANMIQIKISADRLESGKEIEVTAV